MTVAERLLSKQSECGNLRGTLWGALTKVFAAALLLAGGNLLACERPSGRTALMDAAETGNTKRLEQLVSKSVDVNAMDQCGRTALMLATFAGRLDATTILLKAGANPNLHEKGYGTTALHFAASAGSAPVINALIAAGAEVNVRDNYGDTPLMVASALGKDAAVRELIAAKADVSARRDGPINRNALHQAAYTGNANTVSALIAAGASANEPAEAGWTPLMIAMLYGKPDVVDVLIAAGANVNTRSNSGWTALKEAEFRKYSGVAKRLREAGAVDFVDGERK